MLTKLEGKSILLGCLDLNNLAVETPETVVARVKRALPYVRAERIVLAPDCGMKYLPRDVAFDTLKAMVAPHVHPVIVEIGSKSRTASPASSVPWSWCDEPACVCWS